MALKQMYQRQSEGATLYDLGADAANIFLAKNEEKELYSNREPFESLQDKINCLNRSIRLAEQDENNIQLAGNAEGILSVAVGRETRAVGRGAFAEGDSTVAGKGDATLSNDVSPVDNYENSFPGAAAHAEGIGSLAKKAASHAEGYKTQAGGLSSHAEGSETQATGKVSHAEGGSTQATGDFSHAEGCNDNVVNQNTIASGVGSHAEGRGTQATKSASHAEGDRATASGKASHAEGCLTTASGDNSHAEGDGTIASALGSHAEGGYVTIDGVQVKTTASGDFSHAEGAGARAEGAGAHAEGHNTLASGPYAHAEGYETQATNGNTHAEGFKTIAAGLRSHAEGNESQTGVEATAAHAEGWGTQALGIGSHTEGIESIARGNYSHAEGNRTEAIGYISHAEGLKNQAVGKACHVEGSSNIAYGYYDHIEGYNNIANRPSNSYFTLNHIEGNSNEIIQGRQSHIEGALNYLEGNFSHVEGANHNIAINYSHIEGLGHSEIREPYYFWSSTGIIDIAQAANVIGVLITNSAYEEFDGRIYNYKYTVSEGYLPSGDKNFYLGNINRGFIQGGRNNIYIPNLILDWSTYSETEVLTPFLYSQEDLSSYSFMGACFYISEIYLQQDKTLLYSDYSHIQGKYSEPGNYAHIVGNGISSTERSNAHTIDWNGNAMFAGDIDFKYNNTIQSLSDIITNLQAQIDALKSS